MYACLLALLIGAGFWEYRKLFPPPPKPVIVKLTNRQSLKDLRIFSGGGGALIVMPDGTLWRWGVIGGTDGIRKALPEQIGTSTNWLEARAEFNTFAGIQKDGSLWFWNEPRIGRSNPRPTKFGTNLDWAKVFPGNAVSAAIKQDGSLWMWGDNRSARTPVMPAVLQSEPMRVGTNRWKSIATWGSATVGLRQDGSLWVWGTIPSLTKLFPTRSSLPLPPTQICHETNWVVARAGYGIPYAINSDGEWWSLFYDVPDPDSSIATNGRLFSDEMPKGARFFGIITEPVVSAGVYELRDDHTLWAAPFVQSWPPLVKPVGSWQRFGDRADWIGMWSRTSGVMFGLTTDGTLWTWGIDLGVEPGTTFQGRLNQLQVRLANLFGRPARGGSSSSMPPIQIKPRPLMKFVKKL